MNLTSSNGARWGPGSILVVGCAALLLAASMALAADTGGGAKALVKLDDDWSRAAVAKDVERVASFYAEDAVVYPPDQPAVVGRAAAKKAWAGFLADPSFAISWTTTHAEVAGDLGYTTGTYQDSFKGPDGKMVKETGKYVCVWKKQKDGTWKAVHDIWNADAK